MKRTRLILLLAALAIVVLFRIYRRPEAAPAAPISPPPIPEPIPATNPLVLDLYAEYTNAPTFKKQTLYDRVGGLITPEQLSKYEGSHTWDELRADPDHPRSIHLNSAWVVRGSNMPHAGIRVQKNPATGQYEISGGELNMPDDGLGMSYEKDSESGETRTFLNMKKKF
jgi:hypothetical protein